MPHRVFSVLIIWALTSNDFQTVEATKNKYLVSVQHFAKGSSGPRKHVCSGVMLTRRVLVTACSCVTKIREDPITSKMSAMLMETKRIVVYIGTAMDTRSMKRFEDGEVQRVEAMFKHPLCDIEFADDFAVVFTREYFVMKGLLLANTLHRAATIREFVVGRLDLPRACSTFSWMTDNATAPCVTSEFNKKYDFAIEDIAEDILRKAKIRRSPGTVKRSTYGGYKVVLRTLPTEYFVKGRMDVDFVDKKYCTSLVSVCALNPHGCIKGIHGLRCGEWCMRSLDCTERLCHVDTGSPVFCNKVLVGIVSHTRVINCEGTNRILAVVGGFDSALQFVRSSLLEYKELKRLRKESKSPKTSGFLPAILMLIILIHQT